ncbi:MAG: TonB-dependent receptor, partial [Polaribacter sp.]
MKKISILLFLMAFATMSAQRNITGKITDSQKKPLSGVGIYAPDLRKGTVSKEDGTYTLKNVPEGKIKLIFTSLGFKTISKTTNYTGDSQIINIQLEESPFETDEVIVSTPFNKLQSENVMKVDRIGAKAIQRSGATTLIRGLSSIPGVSQVSTGVAIGKPVIRGLNSNQIVVYTQGIRLENQQFGGEHGLAINDAGIASAEVIKGPASLLYGSDAIGGVLYLNPEHFAPQGKTQVDINQRLESNTVGSNTSFALKTSTNNWNFLARGTYAVHADYKIPTGKRVTNTRFKEKDVKAGIGFHKNNFLSEIRYNYNETFLGIPDDGVVDGIEGQTKVYTPEHPYQKIYNHILSWKNQITFENSKLEAEFGYIHNDRNEFEEGDNPSLEMVLKTLSYNVKYHLPKFGKLKTIFGVQGMHQTNTNNDIAEERLIPDAKVNDFGVFAVGNYPLDENNKVEAGIRFDDRSIDTQKGKQFTEALNKSFNSFTASLGYKTNPFENLTARFNVATGFRSPNLAELSSNGVHEGTQRFEKGNSDLKVEKNVEFDLSLEYKTSHFKFFASPFYNKLDNYIYTAPT